MRAQCCWLSEEPNWHTLHRLSRLAFAQAGARSLWRFHCDLRVCYLTCLRAFVLTLCPCVFWQPNAAAGLRSVSFRARWNPCCLHGGDQTAWCSRLLQAQVDFTPCVCNMADEFISHRWLHLLSWAPPSRRQKFKKGASGKDRNARKDKETRAWGEKETLSWKIESLPVIGRRTSVWSCFTSLSIGGCGG